MFAKLKKWLSGCHIPAKDKSFKFTLDAGKDYCINRALETIIKLKNGEGDTEENCRFAIRLLTIAAVKHLETENAAIETNGRGETGNQDTKQD